MMPFCAYVIVIGAWTRQLSSLSAGTCSAGSSHAPQGLAEGSACGVAGPDEVPSEKGGAGANGYTYFVCSQLGGALSRLPQVKPAHIRAARQIKKFVTGKLDTQVTHPAHSWHDCIR